MERADYHVDVSWKAFPLSNSYHALSPAKMAIVDSKTSAMVNALVPAAQQAQWRNLSLVQVDGNEIYTQVSAKLMNEFVPPQGTRLVLPPALPAYVQWRYTPPTHTIMFSMQLADPNGANERAWDFPIFHRGIVYYMRMGLAYECIIDEP